MGIIGVFVHLNKLGALWVGAIILWHAIQYSLLVLKQAHSSRDQADGIRDRPHPKIEHLCVQHFCSDIVGDAIGPFLSVTLRAANGENNSFRISLSDTPWVQLRVDIGSNTLKAIWVRVWTGKMQTEGKTGRRVGGLNS